MKDFINREKLSQLENPSVGTLYFDRPNEAGKLVLEKYGDFGSVTPFELNKLEFYVVGFKIYLESVGRNSRWVFSSELNLDALEKNERITLRKKLNRSDIDFEFYAEDTVRNLTALLLIDKFGVPTTTLVVYIYSTGSIYRLILTGVNKESFLLAYDDSEKWMKVETPLKTGLPAHMTDVYAEESDLFVLRFSPIPIKDDSHLQVDELVLKTKTYLGS